MESTPQPYHERTYSAPIAKVRRAATMLLVDVSEQIPAGVRTFYASGGTFGMFLVAQAPPALGDTEPDEGDRVAIQLAGRSARETRATFLYIVTDAPDLAPLNMRLRAIADGLPAMIAQALLRLRDTPDTDLLFAEYYQRRARGHKVTIEQLAREYNYKPGYLRRLKMEYDRRTGRKR